MKKVGGSVLLTFVLTVISLNDGYCLQAGSYNVKHSHCGGAHTVCMYLRRDLVHDNNGD